jgi:hypothetical protein
MRFRVGLVRVAIDANGGPRPRQELRPFTGHPFPFEKTMVESDPCSASSMTCSAGKPSSLESIHIARNDRDRGYPFQLLDDLALPDASGLQDVLTPAR